MRQCAMSASIGPWRGLDPVDHAGHRRRSTWLEQHVERMEVAVHEVLVVPLRHVRGDRFERALPEPGVAEPRGARETVDVVVAGERAQRGRGNLVDLVRQRRKRADV